jgi:Methylmalonic aciduria and homocystinuria type D protein
MQWSVHPPNPFLQTHLAQLLPDWLEPVRSILIVLQQSNQPLLHRTRVTETEKRKLRGQFIDFGEQVRERLQALGYRAEVFDPRTGLPLFSQPGAIHLDDIAVVRATLGYPTLPQGKCQILQHPVWGSAVYPSILVSAAAPEVVTSIVSGFLEYHHSRSAGDSLTV